MKQVHFFLIILSIIVSSCDKTDYDFSRGKATALRNGEYWIGQGRGSVNNMGIGVNFAFEVFNKKGELRQVLGFSKIPTFPYKYFVKNTNRQLSDSIPGCHFTTISHDGDVVEDMYLVYESDDESNVTVINYDETNRRLKGEFRLKFYIDPKSPKTNPNNPDTIVFTKGQFEVLIE